MTIQEWQTDIHDWAVKKGFWPKDRNISEQAVLFHSEISEFIEEIRDGKKPFDFGHDANGKPVGPAIELADLVIRVLDTCGAYGIDLEEMIRMKMGYNETRPHKHGRKF